MRRRTLLAAGLLAPVAGCLDALSGEDAWRELVMDAPTGVYVAPKRDGMVSYGVEPVGEGECSISVMATRPHSFLTVTGTESSWVGPRSEDSIHLMASIRHRPTGHVVPTSMSVAVDDGPRRALWPMLSQPMGPHHGDNVPLPGDGAYDLRLEVDPLSARPLGSLSGALDGGATVELPIEFERGEIEGLERTLIEPPRRGEPGALAPMEHTGAGDHADDHGDHEGDLDGPPVARVPAVEELPGTVLGSDRIGDAVLAATLFEPPDSPSGPYLAVSLRTPYNGYPLPAATLAAGVDGDLAPLEPVIGPELGSHYGRVLEEPPDELRVVLDAPPQIARHFGYETAFLDGGEVVVGR